MPLYTTGVKFAARVAAGVAVAALGAQAQTPDPSTRVNDRIRALEREAGELARQGRTLLGELRELEVVRSVRVEEARAAQAAAAQAERSLRETSDRTAALERERVAQLPNLEAQLVDIYKNGRGGYARLLLDAKGLRDFARATRAVAAIAALNQRRIDEHRQTLDALKQERTALDAKTRDLQTKVDEARRARAAAERAVAAHTARMDEIAARRDLAAQYASELKAASDRMRGGAGASGSDGSRAAALSIPLAPFKGALAWPVAGRVSARFGQTGGTAVRSGMEIAATGGTAVRAVHGGTVTYAEAFTGLGTLVIVDHGGNSSSHYGFLASAAVRQGDVVQSGAELGRVGASPGGRPALYFEMRVDGRSVDPLQWLQAR